jgi:O-antigen ligase
LNGDTQNINFDSIGTRLHLWLEAIDWIKQRPLTGWGDSGRSAVIDTSPRFSEDFKKRFGHFHNSYIELLLLYGLVGFVFFLGSLLWVYFSLYQQWRKNKVPDDLFYFASMFMVFWLIVNMFESYFILSTGTYLHMIVLGGLYTFSLQKRQEIV